MGRFAGWWYDAFCLPYLNRQKLLLNYLILLHRMEKRLLSRMFCRLHRRSQARWIKTCDSSQCSWYSHFCAHSMKLDAPSVSNSDSGSLVCSLIEGLDQLASRLKGSIHCKRACQDALKQTRYNLNYLAKTMNLYPPLNLFRLFAPSSLISSLALSSPICTQILLAFDWPRNGCRGWQLLHINFCAPLGH